MANNSDAIRRLMNLMESTQQPNLIEGWVDNVKDKLDRRMGNKEREQMAAQLTKEYYTWLGQSNREGTGEDLVRFMTQRIGFNSQDVKVVLSKSGVIGDDAPEAEEESGEEEAAPEAEEKPAGWDPEEGVPLPKDLANAKLNDFKHLGGGLDQAKADNKTEANEIKDDPRKYMSGSGWDNKKITAKLSKMPKGSSLTLGKSTFRLSSGDEATDFYDGPANESINEASNPDVIPRKTIKQVMDAAAAQVNDEYLYNGPKNDAESTKNQANGRNRQSSTVRGDDEGTPNEPGKKGSGQYDAQEMVNILKSDFQITNAKAWVDSLTRKVMNAGGISTMSDNDMHDLALLGWALVRARN